MSNKITEAFAKGKAFIPFITCGDPSLEITEQLVYAMEEAGADLIELGIPFSDPTAEGPVIQEANVRALSGGVTTDKVFDMVAKIRQKTAIPMVFMTYANVVFSYGTEHFIKKAAEVGMDGLILPDVPFEEKEEFDTVCKQYGLDLISLIAPVSYTHLFYFQGSDRYLQEIAGNVNIPVLRKDFTVDEYMIYQAKAFGASAVLLICAILDNVQLKAFGELAQDLGLDALVEAHDEWEVDRALNLEAKIVGVNNRNLHDFTVDMENSVRLRKMAPENTVFVSESGIKTSKDIRILYQNRVDAVLIGETLMRSPDKKAALEELNKDIV